MNEGMLGYIEARRLMDIQCERPGYGTLLAEHGALFPKIGKRLKGMRRMRLGMCYKNACDTSLRSWGGADLMYCEGYATRASLGIPLLHAWTLNVPTMEVIDPTWDDGASYYGWAYTREFIAEAMLSTMQYGIIDSDHPAGWERIHRMITGEIPAAQWRHVLTDMVKSLTEKPLEICEST